MTTVGGQDQSTKTGKLAHLNIIALGPEQEQEPYLPFLIACQRLGAKYQAVDDNKRCMIPEWPLSQTPSLTIPEVLDIIRNGGAYCLIWPKDAPQRVVVFDLDDAVAMTTFKYWYLPDTVQVGTRKGVHHYYLVPQGIVLPNIITEGAMNKAGYGKMGVFTRAKVIVGPGSWFKDKATNEDQQYALDDAEYEPEFATLPMEMAMSLVQMKPTNYADKADLAPESRASADHKDDILAINEAAHKQGKCLIGGNDDFLRYVFSTKWGLRADKALKDDILAINEATHKLCLQWGGKVDDVPKRIRSIIPHTNQMGNFIALALEKGVDLPRLESPNPKDKLMKKKSKVEEANAWLSEWITQEDEVKLVRASDIEVLSKDKRPEPIAQYLAPPKRTVGLLGVSGSGKTTTAMRLIRNVQEAGFSVAYICTDTPDDDLATLMSDTGVDRTQVALLPAIDAASLSLRKIHDDLVAWVAIEDTLPLGLIVVDQFSEFCPLVWQSIGHSRTFDRNLNVEHIRDAFTYIINPLAVRFTSCVLILDFPPKGKDSRDTMSGHPLLLGKYTGGVYLQYSPSATDYERIPRKVREQFEDFKGDKYRWALPIKDRVRRPEDGIRPFAVELTNDKVEFKPLPLPDDGRAIIDSLLGRADQKQTPPAHIDLDTYRDQLTAALSQNEGQLFGHTALARTPPTKGMSLATWRGLITDKRFAQELPTPPTTDIVKGGKVQVQDGAQIDAGLYWRNYNNTHVRVCYLSKHHALADTLPNSAPFPNGKSSSTSHPPL